MSNKLEQFRPCFTYLELSQLLSELSPNSSLYKKIAKFKYKVDVGVNAVAFSTAPKQTLEQSIGAAPESNIGYAAQLAKLESKAQHSPQLLSSEDKYNLLGAKALAGTLTEEEKAEGRALELELYQLDMGTFA